MVMRKTKMVTDRTREKGTEQDDDRTSEELGTEQLTRQLSKKYICNIYVTYQVNPEMSIQEKWTLHIKQSSRTGTSSPDADSVIPRTMFFVGKR